MTRDDDPRTARLPDLRTDEAGPGAALDRATRALRSDPTPAPMGAGDLTATVMGRVATLARGGRELLVRTPDGAAVHDAQGSQVHVADRVLRSAVRRVATSPHLAPDAVRVAVDDTGRVDLAVRVAARYGVPLLPHAADLRAALLLLLDDLLGPSPVPRRVDVEVVDVTLGDPALG